MAKVTMYRGEGFTSNEAFIAVSGDNFAPARVHSEGGERMKTPETFGNISDWQWGKLCITPDWFRDQLVPD
ncbi:MAG: hypothetical protein ACRCYD_09805, partial [Plesiomonas sp.]